MPLESSLPPPAPTSRAATMALVDREWRRLEAALAGLTPEQLGTRGLTPEWRIQDALAHLAGWMRAAKESIEIIVSGRRPETRYEEDIDGWNARWVRERGDLDGGEALRLFNDDREALLRLLEGLPDDQFERRSVGAWVRASLWHHMTEHYHDTWRFRGERGWLPEPPALDSMPPTKDEALLALRIEHDKLYGALLGLSDAELATPGVDGTWAIRDILAHLSAWDRATTIEVPHILAGEATENDIEMVDAFNDRAVEAAKELPIGEVIGEYLDAREALAAFAATVADEAFAPGHPAREWLVEPHASEHYPVIWAWRRGRAAGDGGKAS